MATDVLDDRLVMIAIDDAKHSGKNKVGGVTVAKVTPWEPPSALQSTLMNIGLSCPNIDSRSLWLSSEHSDPDDWGRERLVPGEESQ